MSEQLTFSQPVQFGAEMREFLDRRIRLGEKDAPLCAAIAGAEITPDDDAHDFFNLFRNEHGQPRISYTTRRKVRESGSMPFDSGNHRIAAKPAKIARRLSGWDDAHADAEGRAFDVFASAVAAELDNDTPDYGVTIVTGADITDAYSEDSHCECGVYLGSLGNSCMRYSYCQRYFGVYEDAAEGLAVVRCTTCEGIIGRALLWTDTDGERWLDRPYGDGPTTERLQSWAIDNGRSLLWGGHVGCVNADIRVSLPHSDYDAMPYTDSLTQWCRTCDVLASYGASCDRHGHDHVTLNGTNGTDHHGWYGTCDNCGRTLNDDGDCEYQVVCGGCGTYYCGDDCPNDCYECDGCGAWLSPYDGGECSCEHCPNCGERYTDARELNRTRGACPSCRYVIDAERAAPLPLDNVQWQNGYAVATCPDDDCRSGIYLPEHASPSYGYAQIRTGWHDDMPECPFCRRAVIVTYPESLPAVIDSTTDAGFRAIKTIRLAIPVLHCQSRANDYRERASADTTYDGYLASVARDYDITARAHYAALAAHVTA